MTVPVAVPVLRNKTFLILWGGQTISVLGDTLFTLALMWWVVNATQSGVAVSLVVLATSLPQLILGSMIGVYIDRADRRKMMLVAATLNGIITALLALFYWYGWFSLPLVLFMAVLMSIVTTFDGPAFEASVPVVVGKDDLVRANSIMHMGNSATSIVAPAVSGILIALAGVGAAIFVNALTFFVAAISLLFIQFPSPRIAAASENKNSFMHDFVGGLKFVLGHKVLLPLLSYNALLNLALAPVSVALPLLVLNVWQGGPALLGLVGSFKAVGFLGAAMLLSAAPGIIKKTGPVIIGSVVALGLFTMVVAFAPHQGWLLAGVTMVGFVLVMTNVAAQTIWQREVPDELRGRAFTARETTTSGLRPLGQAVSGPLLNMVGPVVLIGGAGLLCAIGGVFGLLLPSVLHYPHEKKTAQSEAPAVSDD